MDRPAPALAAAAPRWRWRRRLAVGVAALAAGWLALEIAIRCMPLPAALQRPFPATPVLLDRQGRILARIATAQARAHAPVPLAEMGAWLPAATVALEDHRFAEHRGIDVRGTLAAAVRNARAGRVVSGASTITQQLIKMTSGRRARSWTAKAYENLAALRLEREWPKARILEEYLNRSHYGNRIHGPAEAARLYFGKRPADLTLAEAVYLAGLPQAPTRFNPWRRAPAAAERFHRAARRYEALHPAGETQRLQLAAVPAVQPLPTSPPLAPHLVDLLRRGAALRTGRIATTLDLDLQRRVEKIAAERLRKLASRGVTQVAVVILENDTGAVRAMIGSADYRGPAGQINGATIFRSCGSTLKPFVYLQAIERRVLTAASLLPDTPDAIRAEYIDYDPANYDQRFHGPVRVREALANSMNVPAVVTLSRLGARRAYDTLAEWGLRFGRSFDDYGAGLILGNAEVRLLDVTAAYAAFARGGLAPEARLLADAPVRHRALASPESTAIIADILSDNEARRITFGAFSPLAFEGLRVPCKTGTSSGFRDAWTFGVTARHAVGVWVGNFDGRPMGEIAAAAAAAPLWREIVDVLLPADGTVAPPTTGPRLVQREVCRLTGLLPGAPSPGVVPEWFLPGTEPARLAAEMWRTDSGDRAQLVLPPEYALWCVTSWNRLGATVSARGVPLRIMNPAPRAVFVLDPHLPASQQMLRLIASGAPQSEQEWTIDGAPVPLQQGLVLWPLNRGEHRAAVRAGQQTVETVFRVE